MAKEHVAKFVYGEGKAIGVSSFRLSFITFPSSVTSALRHANNEALKRLIDSKQTDKDDPLAPVMLQEALRLHCQVEALLASLPGNYNSERLEQLGLIPNPPELTLTAE